jgi:membrane-associated phospholipid phosphatase
MTAENGAQAAGEALLDVDHKIHEAVEQDRSSTVVKAAGKLSDVGDQPQLRLLCGGMIVLGVLRKDARMIAAGTRMLLAHELATAAKSAVKHRVHRRRPRSASGKHDEKPHAGHRSGKEDTSFPSGHSAGAMAVASAFSALYPEHRNPALIAAGAVALAQIPRCAHYPTDVGVGLTIGAAADGVIGLGWRLLRLASARLLHLPR